MKLFLIRHGNPDYVTDSLTPIGVRQAEAVAERLADEGFSALYSSPMGRARQTAAPTAARLSLPVTVIDGMREVSWGKPNLPREAYADYHPWNLAHRLASEGKDLLRFDPRDCPYWADTLMEPSFVRVSETIDGFLADAGYVRDGIGYRCVRENEDTVALFAHAGANTCALAHMLNLPPLYLFGTTPLEFTSITILNFSAEVGAFFHPELITLNDFKHITGLSV